MVNEYLGGMNQLIKTNLLGIKELSLQEIDLIFEEINSAQRRHSYIRQND